MTSTSTRTPPKRTLLFALKAIITLVLLGALLYRIVEREGVSRLLELLTQVAPFWVAVATLLHLGAAGSGVFRWQSLLRARGVELPLFHLVRMFLIGRFVGAFTPSTTGLDGYRIVEATRVTGQLGTHAAVIAIEKLVGLVSMATVCLLLVPFGLSDRLGSAALLVALGMAFVALLGLSILARPAFARRLIDRLPGVISKRLGRVFEALAGGGLPLGVLLRSVLLGIAAHACLSATFAAAGMALSLRTPLLTLLAAGNAIVIAVLLPVSIGGVGVREGTAVALLASSDVDTSQAVLVAFLSYLTGQVPALIGGLLSLTTESLPSHVSESIAASAEPSSQVNLAE